MSRRPLIAGNWKMNTSRDEAVALAKAIVATPIGGVDLAVFPPFPWLIPVGDVLTGTAVALGAQDCWTEPSGAFTGAVSAPMLAEVCRMVIVGHSERRTRFGDTDEIVAAKLDAALATTLCPILCVGEDLETRQRGRAEAFVADQLMSALSNGPAADLQRCIIAYEPIWAIGTGVAAEASDAETMAAAIREVVARISGEMIAENIKILYGGSVTPANAAATLHQPNVDGALVGGASLKADAFLAIAAAAAQPGGASAGI